MRKAVVRAEFKVAGDATAPDLGEGQFDALVAVFGNVDLGGDRIMPGAFSDTLNAWKASGDPIPVIWSHQWADPDMHIGHVLDAREIPQGLWTRNQLDLEMSKAQSVYRLLKGRRVTQFSFAYDVPPGGERLVSDGETVVNELHKLDLIETGPTLAGMNPSTDLLDVKALEGLADWHRSVMALERAKAGRVLSARNEEDLTRARDLIAGVVAQVAAQEGDGKADDEHDEKAHALGLDVVRASLVAYEALTS